MSHNTDPDPGQLHELVNPLPKDWKLVDVEFEQYEGPTFYPPEPLDAYGVAVLWTPEGYRYEMLKNTHTNTLTRAELLGLRMAIDQALDTGFTAVRLPSPSAGTTTGAPALPWLRGERPDRRLRSVQAAEPLRSAPARETAPTGVSGSPCPTRISPGGTQALPLHCRRPIPNRGVGMGALDAPQYRVPLRLRGVEGRIAVFVVPPEFAGHLAAATPAKNAWTHDFDSGLTGGVRIDRTTDPPTITSYLTRPLKSLDVAGDGWVALLRRDPRPRAKRPYQLVSVTRSIGTGRRSRSGAAPVPIHVVPPMALDDQL